MRVLAALTFASLFCIAAGAADYVEVKGGRFESVLPQGPSPTVSSPVDVPSFAMRAKPVSVAEFAAFVQAHPEWRRDRLPSLFAEKRYLLAWATAAQPGEKIAAQSPVTDVSWFAAKAYCESENARLPTWIEWEYVAAADVSRRDARGDAAWRRQILSWYERPSDAQLRPVGSKPNAYGISDVHGLIWEWVDDFNALFIAGDSRTQGDPDLLKFCGAGAINIIDKDSYAVVMRIALLSSLNAADTTSSLGFRCVQPHEEASQ
jgi:formylglycine-generating enzyme